MPRATASYFPTAIMSRAWRLAGEGARRFGGRPVLYLAEALRQAWAAERLAAAEVRAMRARVLAEVEKIRAEHAAKVARVAGPALSELDRARIAREARAAVAARQAEAAAMWAAYPVPAAAPVVLPAAA